jgi:hypothetical protein
MIDIDDVHQRTVILIPTLTRPHHIAPLLESVRATTTARVLFLCTPHDQPGIDAVTATGAEMMVVTWQPTGDYARKINTGIRHTTEPLIFTGATDLRFHPGWLEAAAKHLQDPAIGVVGTNDAGSPRVIAGTHATHFLITRAYVENYGTIDERRKAMHEGYVHEYVDDELVGTARRRGAWTFAADSIVEHLHPDWNPNVPRDPMYDQQRNRMRLSQPLYQARRRLWT